ncbi:MAG: ArsR family transcriptional regulator [Verrucomicrobiota bacterium JB023]|nr:ArsR family transcriptional regulator [Verrucomicrobiota bacterium JB023]
MKNLDEVSDKEKAWALFSKHGHVLFCLARNSKSRVRDIAEEVGLTERSVRKVIVALEASGHVTIERVGRNNSYDIITNVCLPHHFERKFRFARIFERELWDESSS